MNEQKTGIPLWEKITLSIDEAALYTGLGKAKLYEMTNRADCPFVLWIGKHRLKRIGGR